ncbi:MAG: rhodanese-like domain-containing protein [Ginsengibacter sp.]
MKVLFFALALTMVSCGCNAQNKVRNGNFNTVLKFILNHDVREITVPEAIKRNNVVYVDAREKKEFDVSHLKNAVYVGYDDFSLSRLSNIPKGNEIIVYCSIGKRSEKITKKLTTAGYSNVSNLYGGIFEWVNMGNGVVDMNNKSTDKVHAYGKFWGRWLDKGVKVYN